MRILVTGANGYIGSRIIPRLMEMGHDVRAMVRDPSWIPPAEFEGIEVAVADVLDRNTLDDAMQGIDVAYYFIHSLMAGKSKFERRDLRAAGNFADAAAKAGIKRIIYLGGLGSDNDKLSPHLRSRHDTGVMLARGPVPVTEFRAGSIIGSGSLAFEIFMYLTERVPVVLAPRWINNLIQPISIRDTLRFLTSCLTMPETVGKVFEIGGSDVLSYKEMMLTYARIRGLKRVFITLPFATPRLSAAWIGLITPLPVHAASSIIEGVRNEVRCRDTTACELFGFDTMSLENAIVLAMKKSQRWIFETDNIPNLLDRKLKDGGNLEIIHSRGFIVEKRKISTSASAEHVFRRVQAIGGDNGWPFANRLWRLRYFIDRLFGENTSPQRPDRMTLQVGDRIDCWIVEMVIQDRLLRLKNVEMKLPGEAWIEFKTTPKVDGGCSVSAVSYFRPHGLAGILYWYTTYPAYRFVFRGMICNLVEEAVCGKAAADYSSR